jgi:hypothetical protein
VVAACGGQNSHGARNRSEGRLAGCLRVHELVGSETCPEAVDDNRVACEDAGLGQQDQREQPLGVDASAGACEQVPNSRPTLVATPAFGLKMCQGARETGCAGYSVTLRRRLSSISSRRPCSRSNTKRCIRSEIAALKLTASRPSRNVSSMSCSASARRPSIKASIAWALVACHCWGRCRRRADSRVSAASSASTAWRLARHHTTFSRWA